LNGNNRGYAFIEYVHKSSFTAAKNARTKKIGSNYVHIDIERGRVEKNWKPRRFGGGEGKTRAMPRWLKKELDEIRKRFPGLTEEKGEIVSEEGEEGSIVEINNNTNKESNRNKEESSDRKRRKNRSDSNETIKEDNYYRRKRKRSRSRHNNGSYSRSRSPSYSHHSRSEMMKKKYKREYEMGEII
jgi:U1 small nuclear ribonucleoprotein